MLLSKKMMMLIFYIIIFLFGIVIGSFLNVCIYRIPKQENIVSERSHCMNCGNVLNWYELIPLFSFFIQGGRCRHCKVRLSIQYPFIEALNGVLYVWIFITGGFTLQSILYCLAASVLLVVSVIDWRTFEIPFGCNVLLGIIGLVHLLLDLSHWQSYVIGFFSVSVVFLIIFYATGGRGIGGGDVKLMAVAGLLLGWQGSLLTLMIGSIAGSVIHLTLMKWKGKDRVLAFGPYLSLGILVTMLYGEQIISWYLGFL